MKFIPCIPVFFLFASSLCAQQPENTSGSDLSKLRQGYVDSLRRLVQQCVKDNDVAAAAAVSQELDKMASPANDVLPNTSPCGAWGWPGRLSHIYTADGIATNGKNKGIWHWIDQSKRQFQIEWQDGYVDKMTVSPDGTTLLGVNNLDAKFTLERLPLPTKSIASIVTR